MAQRLFRNALKFRTLNTHSGSRVYYARSGLFMLNRGYRGHFNDNSMNQRRDIDDFDLKQMEWDADYQRRKPMYKKIALGGSLILILYLFGTGKIKIPNFESAKEENKPSET